MHEDRSDRVVAHCCDVLPLSALVIMAVFRCFAKKICDGDVLPLSALVIMAVFRCFAKKICDGILLI